MIQTLTQEFTVETLCTVLGVSRTAYYRYKRGKSYQPTPGKEEKKCLVEQVFQAHKRRYGSRRILAELQEQGHRLGRQQVRTLMKLAGLQSIQPQRRTVKIIRATYHRQYAQKGVLAEPVAESTDAYQT